MGYIIIRPFNSSSLTVAYTHSLTGSHSTFIFSSAFSSEYSLVAASLIPSNLGMWESRFMSIMRDRHMLSSGRMGMLAISEICSQ